MLAQPAKQAIPTAMPLLPTEKERGSGSISSHGRASLAFTFSRWFKEVSPRQILDGAVMFGQKRRRMICAVLGLGHELLFFSLSPVPLRRSRLEVSELVSA